MFLWSPFWFVFGLALLVRLTYLREISNTPFWSLEQWNQSDMDTFLQVARQILEGDLLVRNPYRPIHSWHLAIASEAQWQRWYAPHVFYQMPGYYYFTALLLKLSGGSLDAIKITQSLLGSVHAVLLGLIAQRFMGRNGGLMVGILAASYGPFVAMEPLILRDSLGLLLSTVSFWFVVHALSDEGQGRDHAAGRYWLGAGLTLGIGGLIKDTGMILFAAIWFWLVVRNLNRLLKMKWFGLVFLTVGFVIALLPFILRNLAVGLPPLAVSQQSALVFLYGNIADSPSGGVLFAQASPALGAIIEQTQARPFPLILATLHSYDSNPSLFLVNLWRKFMAIWSNVEVPDNFSYEHIGLHVPVLRMLPRFVCVWLPAILGLAILIGRWYRSKRVQGSHVFVPFPNVVLGLVLIILAAHVVAQSFAPVMSRYRLVLVPFLMLFAGWLLAQGFAWLVKRRWLLLSGLLTGMCILTIVWMAWWSNPELERAALYPSHVGVTATLLLKQQKWSSAWDEFESGITFFEDHGEVGDAIQVRRDRLLYFTLLHRFDLVREDWEVLRAILSRSDPVIRIVEQELLQTPDQHS